MASLYNTGGFKQSKIQEIPRDQLGTWIWPFKFVPLIKGDYLVTSRQFPDVLICAANLESAKQEAKTALEEELEKCVKENGEFPDPLANETLLFPDEHAIRMSTYHEEMLVGLANSKAVDEDGRPLK